jgi:hypothetical protein
MMSNETEMSITTRDNSTNETSFLNLNENIFNKKKNKIIDCSMLDIVERKKEEEVAVEHIEKDRAQTLTQVAEETQKELTKLNVKFATKQKLSSGTSIIAISIIASFAFIIILNDFINLVLFLKKRRRVLIRKRTIRRAKKLELKKEKQELLKKIKEELVQKEKESEELLQKERQLRSVNAWDISDGDDIDELDTINDIIQLSRYNRIIKTNRTNSFDNDNDSIELQVYKAMKKSNNIQYN